MILSDFHSQYEIYKEFLYLFHKWETKVWRIKEVGPRKCSYIPFPFHGNGLIFSVNLTLRWLCLFLRMLLFAFFQSLPADTPQTLIYTYLLFMFSYLKSNCLVPGRNHADISQSLPQWLQGSWVFNVEYLGPFQVLSSEPMLFEPLQYLASHPTTPTICTFFCSDIVIHLFPLTSAPQDDHRSLRTLVKRDRIICGQAP